MPLNSCRLWLALPAEFSVCRGSFPIQRLKTAQPLEVRCAFRLWFENSLRAGLKYDPAPPTKYSSACRGSADPWEQAAQQTAQETAANPSTAHRLSSPQKHHPLTQVSSRSFFQASPVVVSLLFGAVLPCIQSLGSRITSQELSGPPSCFPCLFSCYR